MTPEEVIEFWGGKKKAADAICKASSNVSQWLKKGLIPISTQYEIARHSGYKLRPDSATVYMEKLGYNPPKTASDGDIKPQPLR